MIDVLDKLRGGLVASCQPVDEGPMDRPDIVAAMAQAAVLGGAVGLRIEGVENLRAVRPFVSVPIIGIVKSDWENTPVRITVRVADVNGLIQAGADVVAYDATDRPRQDDRSDVLKTILAGGSVAMADCSTLEDAQTALMHGASIIGTTLSGYTENTANDVDGPDLDLLGAFSKLEAFVMAEGRYNTPNLVLQAINAGADCVTVGSALTRLEHVTSWFVDAMRGENQ